MVAVVAVVAVVAFLSSAMSGNSAINVILAQSLTGISGVINKTMKATSILLREL